jgi:hypothetical protein
MPVLTLLPGDMAYQSDGYVAKAPVAATLGHTAFGLFGGFSLGPSLAELHESSLCVAAEQAAPWLALFGPAALWLLLRGWQELRTRTGGVGLVFLTIASAPVIAAAGVLADVGPKVRYWCWLVAPLVVWLGAGAARGWDGAGRWLTRAAFAALVGVNLMALISRYDDPRYANEDVRSVCEYIAAAPQGRIPVFVVADYMAPPVRYYLNSLETLEHWLPRVPHEPVTASEQLSRAVARPWLVHPRTEADIREPEPWDDASIASWAEDVKSIASPGGSFWLIYTRPFHGDAEGVLLQHLEKRGCITLERNFAGVQLYRGELKN